MTLQLDKYILLKSKHSFLLSFPIEINERRVTISSFERKLQDFCLQRLQSCLCTIPSIKVLYSYVESLCGHKKMSKLESSVPKIRQFVLGIEVPLRPNLKA